MSAGLGDLVGRSYGPFVVEVSRDRVAEFADVTGDDPARWSDHAPPLFANVALFAVAPALLEDPAVAPFTTSLIHSEQTFEWGRSLAIGERLRVTGEVAGVRARGPVNLVTFRLSVDADAGTWLAGEAVFLMSDAAAAESAEEPEPDALVAPEIDGPATTRELPDVGGELESLRCGASRLDLVRYAAVTRDWNPIHWDHRSAVAAGLPGIVVHGLLMAAWAGRAASRYAPNPHPLASMSLRFRRPLRPGVAAVVTGSVDAVASDGADLDLVLASGGERLVTGRARVTR
ncbi:MAG TPA: MaoC/PaaZ C-terminal domain-containing protein [Acidimicrobiia bacterium]|nr:MaoC/PaaZ C-terminal domain-containing protein [Acidimicrobiia bacterium]